MAYTEWKVNGSNLLNLAKSISSGSEFQRQKWNSWSEATNPMTLKQANKGWFKQVEWVCSWHKTNKNPGKY